MNSETGPLVVVGASLAGIRAIEEAREQGYTGDIVLIGAEPHLPYDRPPLSKEFLAAGASADHLTTEDELLGRWGVDARLGIRAVGLDVTDRSVIVEGGRVPYGRLIVATGATPRTLADLPPLDGVLTLRNLEDASELRERLGAGVRVVVIGAGFIGAETASSAKAGGADVTILEGAPVPLVRAVGDVVGLALSSMHERYGVRFESGVRIERILGDTHVTGVRLGSGEIVPADVVVVGVGAVPATDWLRGSGIELHPVDGGIVCDATLRTSVPDVYAAGDLVHWPNALMDADMRLENWTNASDQGRHAARNALAPDMAREYSTVPYFWSDWYGQRIQFVGSARADEVRFVAGDPLGESFVALYRSGSRLIGAATLNERRAIMKYRRMIADRASWEDALALSLGASVS